MVFGIIFKLFLYNLVCLMLEFRNNAKLLDSLVSVLGIRALQCILLKVALLVGVEVHAGVAFEGFSEPPPDQTKDSE